MDYINDATYCTNLINDEVENLDLEYLIGTKNGKKEKKYGQIFKTTNEDLSVILSNFSLKDKNILSVLASSEQLFSCYYLGAKNVDTFDRNVLCYYYFFLKKWMILNDLDRINISNDGLMRVINFHDNSEEEKNAYEFWKYVLEHTRKQIMSSTNLFCSYDTVKGNVPYNGKTKKLSKIIASIKPNYTHLDLFRPIYNIDKKYEIIILSNILEYLKSNVDNTRETYKITSQNLFNLLDYDGIAICSKIKLFNQEDILSPEFERNFNILDESSNNYYVLQKRK